MNRRLAVGTVSAAVFLLALIAFFAFYQRPAAPPKAAAKLAEPAEPEPTGEPPPPVPERPQAVKEAAVTPSLGASAAASALPDPARDALDEASLMGELRELRGSNPALTLALAREAQARFKNSPDAAEQSWFVVKSLTDLGRHDEARVEGRTLVKAYPGTRWAEDTYRHLFVNPPTDPAERGYGKARELP